MHSMARRVPVEIFVDYESAEEQQTASEECLAVCVDHKLLMSSSRRRSSSLDATKENRNHRNRKSLAEKQHMERMVCTLLNFLDS